MPIIGIALCGAAWISFNLGLAMLPIEFVFMGFGLQAGFVGFLLINQHQIDIDI